MSVEVGSFQGQLAPTAPMLLASATAPGVPPAQAPAQPPAAHAAAEVAGGIPAALNVSCNGNYGIYLIARRGVQCMCLPCQSQRAVLPAAAWIMSPTEFERHSGMPTAKKWRMSIKVAHVGEPELPLGRWLELKGICQTRGGAKAAASSPEGSTHEQAQQMQQQQQQSQHHQLAPQHHHHQQMLQLQKPKNAGSPADSRDTTDALRPCASSLARVLLQGLGRDQTGQVQGTGSRPGTPQHTSSSTQQHQPVNHRLSEEPPHCSNGSSGRAAFPFDVAAQLRSCFPSQQAGPAAAAASVAAAARMEAARAAAYTAAAAEAEAAAAQAERRACKQRQQHLPQEQGSNEASPNGRSSSSSQGAQPRRTPPTLLQIPCPADAPPRHDEPAPPASAMYNGVDPVPLEQAAAAAARGDDSLWLRSPMRRTPCSARQGLPGASRAHNQEAVAAEAFRRLISAHLHPKAAAAAAAAAGAAGRPGGQGSAGLTSAAAAAAALLAGSIPAGIAGSRPSDGSSDATAAAGGGSMDSLAAAAAAAAAADAAAAAAGEEEEDEVEGGICVGPEHQADLPRVRPLPAFAAAVALMEMRKSGNRGPEPEEALRMALEEKSRSDLLPRDAVEDVWERAASGLALERAQRHRKPPGWQAGYVDPLKPLASQHQADSGPYGNAGAAAAGGLHQHELGPEADSARNRKRANGMQQQEDGLLQSSKKMRCSSAGPAGMPTQHNGLQASRLGPGTAPPGAKGRRGYMEGGMAECGGEPAAHGGAPRVPPNGFWAAPSRQPAYTAPVGPELLSWVLLVPPAAATLARPAWADAPAAAAPVPAPPAPAAAPAAAAAAPAAPAPVGEVQPVAEAAAPGSDTQAAAVSLDAPDASALIQRVSEKPGLEQDLLQQPAKAIAVPAPEANSNMEVDTPPQQQQQQQPEQLDAEMADAAGVASTGAFAAHTPVAALATAAPAPGAPAREEAAATAFLQTQQPPAIITAVAPPPAAAVTVAAAGAGPCVECVAAQGSAVEVRIVLDGCVFVGQLKEVSRLEMARSRVGAAVDPIKQNEVHRLPPAGSTCALCHAMEAPGAHMDQAKALRSCGLSNRGLGPLMPVCMPPAKQTNSGTRSEQQTGSAAPRPAEPAGAVAGAAAAQADSKPAAAAGSNPAAESEVVWVHRQCALWSPEVYPDPSGVLLHLPGAIRRGRATRCSHCGQKGATLKCVERSCAQHFHLACARVAGCTLIPEPYTIGCPAHEPKLSELPAAAVLTAFPSTKAPQEQHQQHQQQHGALTEHPQLPVLRCRTTRHRAPGDAAGGSGTPLAGSRAERDGTCTPLFHQGTGGASPMHVDSCGMGAESDFTPRAGSEDRDMDGHGGHNTTLTGHKRGRGGRSRLRRQTNTDWADTARFEQRGDSPHTHMDNGTPTLGGGRPGSARPSNSRGGGAQLHDSRGRFMSHAAAQLLASGFTSTPPGSARQHSLGRDTPGAFDTPEDSRGGTPAASDGGYSTPRGGAADADGNMSDVSSGLPLSEGSLGGTTGQPGRAGRCAVCVVQRKGKCGTESAPKKCLRRMLQEQQQAERAKKAAPIHSVAAAASAVALVAAEAEALAALRGSPALKGTPEPTSATAMSALALAAAEAEALCAARNSPALRVKQEEQADSAAQVPDSIAVALEAPAVTAAAAPAELQQASPAAAETEASPVPATRQEPPVVAAAVQTQQQPLQAAVQQPVLGHFQRMLMSDDAPQVAAAPPAVHQLHIAAAAVTQQPLQQPAVQQEQTEQVAQGCTLLQLQPQQVQAVQQLPLPVAQVLAQPQGEVTGEAGSAATAAGTAAGEPAVMPELC